MRRMSCFLLIDSLQTYMRYVGDCDSSDFNSPKKAKECWNVAVTQLHKQKLNINRLRKTNLRLIDRVINLSSLTNHLRQQLLLSENAENIATLPGSSSE
ncbi:hypothetical protein RN001_001586 [Aquatica leii]|uniref:Uncharacterized protein n=1 Tax=Aquatica leii TaxID=1421715 RepID=A0AAN7SSN7_9COLE|nr:hypothetical protein RN001_001586 [Aquatica leii]